MHEVILSSKLSPDQIWRGAFRHVGKFKGSQREDWTTKLWWKCNEAPYEAAIRQEAFYTKTKSGDILYFLIVNKSHKKNNLTNTECIY